jgi:hypothetical protein
MDDFAALAARLAGLVDDVRGCLIVSRDAMILGAYPESSEAEIKPVWSRFLALGDVARGFVELEDQICSYVRRGDHAAFVVTGPGVRPGFVLEQIDQTLAAADETADPNRLKLPEARVQPRPTPQGEPMPRPIERTPAAVLPQSSVAAAASIAATPAPSVRPTEPDAAAQDPPGSFELEETSGDADVSKAPKPLTTADPEADQAALVREFAGLLQDDDGAADW